MYTLLLTICLFALRCVSTRLHIPLLLVLGVLLRINQYTCQCCLRYLTYIPTAPRESQSNLDIPSLSRESIVNAE